jgi:hypothetical protein
MTVQRKKKLVTEQMYANLADVPMSKGEGKDLLMEVKDANKKVRRHLYCLAISGVHEAMGYSSVEDMFKYSLTNMSLKEAHKEVARGKIEIVIYNRNVDAIGTRRGAHLDAFYTGGHLKKSSDFGCFIKSVNSILHAARCIKTESRDGKLGAKHIRLGVARVFAAEGVEAEPKQQVNETAIDVVSNLSKEVTSIKTLKKLRAIFTSRIKELEAIKQ